MNEIEELEAQLKANKEERESIEETLSILRNKETMRQLRESEADIKAGRTKEIKTVQDILDPW